MKNMTLVCSGKVCTSTENTRVGGEKIRFFELPSDEKLRDAWKKLFKANNVESDANVKEVLCELHFDKNCFDDNKQLKPDSIPTQANNKKPVINTKFSSAYDEPAVKKMKIDNTKDNSVSEVKKVEIISGKTTSKKVKPYRLTVQIDKICLNSSSKTKKQSEININFVAPCVTSDIYKSLGQSIELRNGKELPAYNQCLVCKKVFIDASKLFVHLKDHFTCDICKTEFTSKKSHSRHYQVHQNDSVEFPFKCHICNALFVEKEMLRSHEHMKKLSRDLEIKLYNCKECNITFKNDNTYKRHLQIHKQESKALAGNVKQIKAKAVSVPEKPAVDFDCKVCHIKLASSTEVENHAKTHEVENKKDPIAL